jgi:hypothetical protein
VQQPRVQHKMNAGSLVNFESELNLTVFRGFEKVFEIFYDRY